MPKHFTTQDGELIKTTIGVTTADITDAGTFGKQLLQQPSKRFAQDALSVPLPFAAFTHTLDQEQWRKAAKVTSTKPTAISGIIKSSTGYVKCLDHDGTWEAVVGSVDPTSDIAPNFTASGDNIPRFYAIIPCDDQGNLDGDLSYLYLDSNQLTSFDGTGLSALTYLTIANNQLTSFDGTGLSALTTLTLVNNQLTSFDGTGLSSLTHLRFDRNQLTSFDGTGLSALTYLDLRANLLTSFDSTGLGAVTTLYLQNNQLTSFNGTELGELTNLDLANNNLPSFVGTGLGKVTTLTLDNNQLVSFVGLGLSLATVIIVSNNQITSFDGTGLDALDILNLDNNQLTSFDGTGLSSLTGIAIRNNQLDSIIMSGQDLSFQVSGIFGSNVGQNNLDLAALIAFLESLGTTTTGVIQYGSNPGSSAFETYLATADDKGYIWLNN